jgi:flagellar basal body P-ring formation protein FlgA
MKVSSFDKRPVGFFCCRSEAGARLLRSAATAAGIAVAASLVLSILTPDAAHSAETARPKLRAAVTVTSDLVTVGDFFDDAGEVGKVALFRAPDLGTTGPVSARRVVDLARAAGLAVVDTDGLVEIPVSRLGRPVESAEIARLVATEALRRPGRNDDVGIDDLDVTFDAPLEPRQADLRSSTPVRVVSFSYVPLGGRFDALVQIDKGETTERLHLRGTVTEMAAIATLSRPMSRGDIVSADDIQIERIPRARVGSLRTVVDSREIAGQQARRSLRAGQPVIAGDFARPQVVARGETVTVIYRTAALQVSGRGIAQQPGAVGDLVAILNPQSKRTVHATVTGLGRVEVSAPATTLAQAAPVAANAPAAAPFTR